LIWCAGTRPDDQRIDEVPDPEDEDLRIRRIGCAALREDPNHRVVELNAEFPLVERPTGVDPERLCDLPAELHRQRLVEQREETVLGRAAAMSPTGGNRPPAQPVAGRCAAAARGPCPADRPCRRRSGWRTSATTAAESRRGHRVPVPLHEHERTTDCSTTIGTIMISNARRRALGIQLLNALPSSHWPRRRAAKRCGSASGRYRACSSAGFTAKGSGGSDQGDSRRRAPPAGTGGWPDPFHLGAGGGLICTSTHAR